MGSDNEYISKTSLFSYLDAWKDSYTILIPILLIITAEMLLYAGQMKAGVGLHVFIILMLSLSLGWLRDSNVAGTFQVLTLLPLLRLLNISMPVFSETTLYLYIYIYTPLFFAAYLLLRHENLAIFQQRFSWEIVTKVVLYIFIAVLIGYAIAYGEDQIINAGNLISDLTFFSLLKLSFVMVVFVGFVEELIFRFLLQTKLENSFSRSGGLVLTALVFGVMHSGYGTLYEIAFVTLAGLVLGYMFQRTRSLFLVSLTHGLTNVILFGLMPFM